MRWKQLGIAAALFAASIGAAVSAQPSSDARKIRQELDTMKGIFQTSLRYALEDERDEPGKVVFEQDIEAYYLTGQGAIFIVPVHLRESFGLPVAALEAYVLAAENKQLLSENFLRDMEKEIERATRDAHAAIADAHRDLTWEFEGEAPEPPEAPEAPAVAPPPGAPAPPAPEPNPGDDRVRARVHVRSAERAREHLEELRGRLAEQKESAEQQRQELEAAFAKVRQGLIDALSKHGDSMTILKPEESITLILKKESSWHALQGPFWGAASSEDGLATVLSVKKSDVSDLKAGRISRDQFLGRVRESTQ